MTVLSSKDTEAILTLCLMASLADGRNHRSECQEIRAISDAFADPNVDVTALRDEVLLNQPDLRAVIGRLSSRETINAAWRLIVRICDADDTRSIHEHRFLLSFRAAAGLLSDEEASTKAGLSDMVSRAAVTSAALARLPQTVARLAILPLRQRMIYRIASTHGAEVTHHSVAEFISTLDMAGPRGANDDCSAKIANGSTNAFATTYALGHTARFWHDSGMKLDESALRSTFHELVEAGTRLEPRYSTSIAVEITRLAEADLTGLMKCCQ